MPFLGLNASMDDERNPAGKKGQDGSLTEVNSVSEPISTEDFSLTLCPEETSAVELGLNSGPTTPAPIVCSPRSVEAPRAKALHSLLPPFKDVHRLPDVSQSLTRSGGPDSLKTSAAHTEAGGSDLCAAILLHCLFCHPLHCLLETLRGCGVCVGSLFSSLCGGEPVTAPPLSELARNCDPCPGAVGSSLRDCDICIPASECLDLAMEISQMLHH